MKQSWYSTKIFRFGRRDVANSFLEKRPLMQVQLEQEINIQNMNVELVAQMFKNYRSNVLFHLEGMQS